nr:hypothetical protein [Tanacetum cinerariifolium]
MFLEIVFKTCDPKHAVTKTNSCHLDTTSHHPAAVDTTDNTIDTAANHIQVGHKLPTVEHHTLQPYAQTLQHTCPNDMPVCRPSSQSLPNESPCYPSEIVFKTCDPKHAVTKTNSCHLDTTSHHPAAVDTADNTIDTAANHIQVGHKLPTVEHHTLQPYAQTLQHTYPNDMPVCRPSSQSLPNESPCYPSGYINPTQMVLGLWE